MANVAAVVLAAGRARRFGSSEHDSKVLATIDGEPLVRRVVLTALASRANPVVVVVGHAADAVAHALRDLPIVRVHNGDYMSGMAGSLKAGLAALPAQADGAIVLLADMPLVNVVTLDALVAAFDAAAGSAIDAIVPSYAGKPGNPVLLARRMFGAVAGLDGDAGARKLLEEPGRRLVVCAVDDPGVAIDIDTRDALHVLREGRRSGG